MVIISVTSVTIPDPSDLYFFTKLLTYSTNPFHHCSVGIGLKELRGQISKCLKFCTGIEI